MSPFVIVTAILGAAVLASYVHGVRTRPYGISGSALFGRMPAAMRTVYVRMMFVAAAGFFPPFVYFAGHPDVRVLGASRTAVELLYALVLVPSALWIGLTYRYLAAPSALRFWLVRMDLFAVALGSLGLVGALVVIEPAPSSGVLACLVASQLAFCVQTVLLDALLWPKYVRDRVAEASGVPAAHARRVSASSVQVGSS